jgi:Flp pilus assembly protein TadG
MRRLLRLLRSRHANQAGYVAILVATLIPTVFIACAAVAVDTGTWYAQQKDMQKAADAAALAGVPFLPNDMASATTKALDVAKRNGYDDADPNVVVVVGLGDRPTKLRVTITAKVPNTFGKVIGVPTVTLHESAVADYQGPQPMGSPCNTFGNEPPGGTGGSTPPPPGTALGSAPFANCQPVFPNTMARPQFWGGINGPATDKIQGDQYGSTICGSNVDGCTGSTNNDLDPFGYVYVVKVQPAAVNTDINLQLYDPEFANTNSACENLPDSVTSGSPTWGTTGNVNPWVTKADAKDRYTDDGPNFKTFCNGDFFQSGVGTTPFTTSFVLRGTSASDNPKTSSVQNDTGGQPCIKQYGGLNPTWNTNLLTSGASGYNADLAQVFHNWTSLCTFRPTEAGDYYLQVRTNVSLSGSGAGTLIKSGNAAAAAATGNSTTGAGLNSFAMRAVTQSGKETSVAVAGYNHMPIYINALGSSSTFNLIRVPPGAAGQFVSFSFFDAADASGGSGGSFQILTPSDATGSITSTPFPGGCAALVSGSASSLSNCTAPVSSSQNNGKLETITVPIPTDYTCNFASFGGCWYQVKITFNGATSVTDFTTWNATVVGDPVRLIE